MKNDDKKEVLETKSSSSENSLTSQKRKKYTQAFVAAMMVCTIVGSGIVKDSVLWTAAAGYKAIYGILFVWIAFLFIGIAMSDNVSMLPEKGGAYAWTRITFGKFWGCQIGWIYLIGYTCLSVILSWLAYINTLNALTFFFPGEVGFIASNIFSIIVPMGFILVFSIIFGIGVKRTVQVIIGFFILKTTMWLTIVGIGLLHFTPTGSNSLPADSLLNSIFSVGSLSVFAMLGLDSPSVIADDIHEPAKNFLRGTIVGMIIVLILYLSTIIMIMGLVGREGAILYQDTGITGIFLNVLQMPDPVILVFVVLSIIGTLCVTMYLVVRLSGAMSEHHDFYFGKSALKRKEKQKDALGAYKIEMPGQILYFQLVIYALFFFLIYIESFYSTYFVLFVVYYLGIFAILIILLMIGITNFKAHRMGLDKERSEDSNEFRWTKGHVIPLVGMISIGFIIVLSAYLMWVEPAFPLPGPEDTRYYLFWQYFAKFFPILMIVPGLLYWLVIGKKKSVND